MYSGLNDTELLDLLKADDEAAFAELYNRYWKLLFVTANNILQNYTSAQDVVQDVFASLWQRRLLLAITSLKPWLLQATRFQVFKAIRAEKLSADFYERLADASKYLIVEEPILFKELQQILQTIIQTLPPDQQAIFKMSREENLTYREIAEKMGISVKTVEKKISRSLRDIHTGLDKSSISILLIAWLVNR